MTCQTDGRNKWIEDLLSDKSLFDVYCKYGGIWDTSFNKWVVIFSGALCFFGLLASSCFMPEVFTKEALVETVRGWTSLAVTFSATILGFLIAGFSVFATVGKPELFIDLAKIESKKNNINNLLQEVMYPFINCFVNYISYLSASLIINFASQKGVVVSSIANSIIKDANIVYILPVFMFTFIIWTIIILLKLKSFVWNVYSSMIIFILYYSIANENEGENGEEDPL